MWNTHAATNLLSMLNRINIYFHITFNICGGPLLAARKIAAWHFLNTFSSLRSHDSDSMLCATLTCNAGNFSAEMTHFKCWVLSPLGEPDTCVDRQLQQLQRLNLKLSADSSWTWTFVAECLGAERYSLLTVMNLELYRTIQTWNPFYLFISEVYRYLYG